MVRSDQPTATESAGGRTTGKKGVIAGALPAAGTTEIGEIAKGTMIAVNVETEKITEGVMNARAAGMMTGEIAIGVTLEKEMKNTNVVDHLTGTRSPEGIKATLAAAIERTPREAKTLRKKNNSNVRTTQSSERI